jgi:cytochrome c oxidase assembly factor CtaG
VIGDLSLAVVAGPPPALTWQRALTSWRVQPGVLAAVVVLFAGYAAALRVRRRAGLPPWPRARTWYFCAGAGWIALIGLSFLGVYDDTLFWVRAVQNVVLLMIAPMLLAMGAPISLLRDVTPPRWRPPLARVLRSAPARALTYPLLITVVLVLPLPALYFSPLYELTLRSATASGLAGLIVAVTGFVYFWTRFRIDPTPRQDSYGLTLVITVVEMIGDAVLGVVLWLGPLVAAGYYLAIARGWGPSPRIDQDLGAGVLWVGGDVVGLPFIAVIFGRMVREDESRAEAVDAALDAAETSVAAGATPDAESTGDAALTATPARPQPPVRLWWEDHPELSQRFRRR